MLDAALGALRRGTSRSVSPRLLSVGQQVQRVLPAADDMPPVPGATGKARISLSETARDATDWREAR